MSRPLFIDDVDTDLLLKDFGDLLDPDMPPDEFLEACFARDIATDEDHENITWADRSIFPFSHHMHKQMADKAYRLDASLPVQQIMDLTRKQSLFSNPPQAPTKNCDLYTFAVHGLHDLWTRLHRKTRRTIREPKPEGTIYLSQKDTKIIRVAKEMELSLGDLSLGCSVRIRVFTSRTPKTLLTRALFLIHLESLRAVKLLLRDVLQSNEPVEIGIAPWVEDVPKNPILPVGYTFGWQQLANAIEAELDPQPVDDRLDKGTIRKAISAFEADPARDAFRVAFFGNGCARIAMAFPHRYLKSKTAQRA